MSVKKTFENLLTQDDLKAPVSLDLVKSELQKPEGAQVFEIDTWPILLFLKGIGFEKLVFYPASIDIVERWVQRIQTFENEFIQDPENFLREEYNWNEKNLETDEIIIECIGTEVRKDRKSFQTIHTVPPMDAPLGISSEAANHFLDEVRRQSPQEIYQRILSILVEYERDARNIDQAQWARLIADIISVALQSHLLEKANRIAQQHREALTHIWEDHSRLLRLLAAYDPKPSELNEWAQLFEHCSNELIIGFLETDLSSEAGPQILKLMNYRAQTNPDHLIPLIRHQPLSVQRLLMQWLAAQWRPKHLSFLNGTLELLVATVFDEELFKLWITAVLRSSPKEAFEKLKEYFKSSKLFWKKSQVNISFQRALLSVLSENQSVDTLEFLKQIRKNISTEFTHQIDTMLGTSRKVKS